MRRREVRGEKRRVREPSCEREVSILATVVGTKLRNYTFCK